MMSKSITYSNFTYHAYFDLYGKGLLWIKHTVESFVKQTLAMDTGPSYKKGVLISEILYVSIEV